MYAMNTRLHLEMLDDDTFLGVYEVKVVCTEPVRPGLQKLALFQLFGAATWVFASAAAAT